MTSKIMLITGAARGIGATTARLAAQRGYAVCINYARAAKEADALVSDIRKAEGRAIAVQADIARDDDVKRLFETCDREFGKLDVLVNNAGIVGEPRRVDAMTREVLESVFATNVFGPYYAAREAVKRMSTQHGGHGGVIVNISSIAARHGGMAGETPYAASKGALDTFTIGLAREVGREGIRVNAIRPGLILTDMHEVHGGRAAVEKLTPTIPLGRAGNPEEIAETVLWLASDAASYLHGALIDVSGGR